jgi:hypothetical protein
MTGSGFNPGRGRDFFILYSIQAGSEVHPHFYPMGIKVFFLGCKSTPGCEARHLPLFSIMVRDPKEG